MKVLVTGAAGFIGMFVAQRYIERGDEVTGVDNLNDYYDVKLKQARLDRLQAANNFKFIHANIADRNAMRELFAQRFDLVVHMAAQAGVRYSIDHPDVYIDSNVTGFGNILEGCRHGGVKHLVYASSSSVYGANKQMPFSVHDNVDHPISLYAATKKANELMAHCYASLYELPVTGLRFFTVYGPWGRPDMAPIRFAENIMANKPIDVFNYGKHRRDFTYIDDIVEGVIKVADQRAKPDQDWSALKPDPGTSFAPFRLYNIGNGRPVELLRFIELLEQCLGRKAQKNLLPMQ
ncbi:MAG: NAD-dependent epimerase/dehydratase family protein, partial [Gammaproteobacteria bacterium]|nr:NAD-dependent epimerase/dehydratase family protein [Gammaproteobacteria bacterium]